jgi:hypothetical protein
MSAIHLRVQIPSDFKSTARARAEELVISTVDAIPYVQGVESVASPERGGPEWGRRLTEADEWVVRTALANVASDLDRALAAIPPDELDRIEYADVVEITRV